MSIYEWIWRRTTGRPFTYIIRDWWVDYEPLWIIGMIALGATLGEHYGFLTVMKILAIFAVGVFFGHLFWGTPYRMGQKGDRVREITLEFDERFRETLLSGSKTITTRRLRHGRKGDTFKAFEAEFCLIQVYPISRMNAISLWFLEGFESRQQFEQYLDGKYPHTDTLWLHSFRQIK